MTRRTKKDGIPAAPEDPTPVEVSEDPAADEVSEEKVIRLDEVKREKLKGFRVPARWVKATLDAEFEDSEPLSAEIEVGGLTVQDVIWAGQFDRVAGELWEFFDGRVRNWNVMAFDRATGQWAIAPSPAEIGKEAFRLVDPQTVFYLVGCLQKAIYRGGDDLPKDSKNSESSPEVFLVDDET